MKRDVRNRCTVVIFWVLAAFNNCIDHIQATECADERTCHFGTLASYGLHMQWLASETSCNVTGCYLSDATSTGFCQDRPPCRNRHAAAILSFASSSGCDENRFVARRTALRSICAFSSVGVCCNGCDSGTQPSQCHTQDDIPLGTSIWIGTHVALGVIATFSVWDPLAGTRGYTPVVLASADSNEDLKL
jgi:hypothetical protein